MQTNSTVTWADNSDGSNIALFLSFSPSYDNRILNVSKSVNIHMTEFDPDSNPPTSTAAYDALSLATPITTSLQFDLSSIEDTWDVDDTLP